MANPKRDKRRERFAGQIFAHLVAREFEHVGKVDDPADALELVQELSKCAVRYADVLAEELDKFGPPATY